MPNIDIGVIRQRIGRAQQVISKLPDVLTAATQANIVAITRQQEASKSPVPESLEEVSNRLREAQTSQNIATDLSNYKPLIPESAVQRRRGSNSSVEGTGVGNDRNRSNAKKQIISPLNNLNNEISNRAKELTKLGLEKTRLMEQTDRLEKQVATISAKLQSLINTGASIERIQQYEAMLEKYSLLYDTTKATLEKIKKLYDARYKALELLRKKREELQKSFWKNYDRVMAIIKKFREIPKKLKFPKLPKLPTLNLRKGNIKTKLMDVINKIKQKSRDAAKLGLTKSKEEAQEKIRDPKKGDTFQKAASKARDALKKARETAQLVEAKRNAILDATIGQVDNELKKARAAITNAQKQIETGIDKAAAKSAAALSKIEEAKQRAEQLRDSQLTKLDNFASNLARQAASGIKEAQDILNKELVSADMKSSPNLANRSAEELQKVDELQQLTTKFLNQNNIKNFTTGVGVASTLRSARQQSLTLDQFKAKYTDAFNQGAYDSTNRIGNVSGVYIVVTTYYQKGNVGSTSMGPVIPQSTDLSTVTQPGTTLSTVRVPRENTPVLTTTQATVPAPITQVNPNIPISGRSASSAPVQAPVNTPATPTTPTTQRNNPAACEELRRLRQTIAKLNADSEAIDNKINSILESNGNKETPEVTSLIQKGYELNNAAISAGQRIQTLQSQCPDAGGSTPVIRNRTVSTPTTNTRPQTPATPATTSPRSANSVGGVQTQKSCDSLKKLEADIEKLKKQSSDIKDRINTIFRSNGGVDTPEVSNLQRQEVNIVNLLTKLVPQRDSMREVLKGQCG